MPPLLMLIFDFFTRGALKSSHLREIGLIPVCDILFASVPSIKGNVRNEYNKDNAPNRLSIERSYYPSYKKGTHKRV